MEGIISFIATNPSSAIIVVALSLAGLFSYLLFGSFKEQVKDVKLSADKFTNQFDYMKSTLESSMTEMRKALNTHKEDMGKATKAINGDMLKMQERVFELKTSIKAELDAVKFLSNETGRNLELANQVSKLAVESLNEKLGRVILIEKSLDLYGKQIEKIQEGVGGLQTDKTKNHQWFTSIGKALAAHKEQLSKLESDIKKGKKDEI